MRSSRVVSVVAAAVLAVAGLGACDPPPRSQFTVAVAASASDAPDGNPGDGVCAASSSSSSSSDLCTLTAALQEANALGRADIHLPAAKVLGLDGVTITGDVALFGSGFDVTTFPNFTITVAPGAKLAVHDVGSALGPVYVSVKQSIVVGGSLVFDRSSIVHDSAPSIDILAGGGAVITDSNIGGYAAALRSEGSSAIVGSTVHVALGMPHILRGAGSSGLASTALPAGWHGGGCLGTVPSSSGYNRADGTCGLSGVGDGPLASSEMVIPGEPNATPMTAVLFPTITSSLVDAVPLGVAGCSTSRRDLLGNPRGVDGNGDGVAGCDIGSVELQPVP